jgi:hypothetical protein
MTQYKMTAAALVVGATALTAPSFVAAEETSITAAAGTLTRAARHDFTVVIPRFLSFRVGAAAAAISEVTCSPTAAVLGDATVVACAGGDAAGGVSNVRVRSNAGQITINVATLGALSNGVDTLPYSEIRTASSSAQLPAPAAAGLPSGATSGNVNVALSAGAVTDRAATWTYTYANTAIYAPGTYGSNGTGGNNGRATYTASSP